MTEQPTDRRKRRLFNASLAAATKRPRWRAQVLQLTTSGGEPRAPPPQAPASQASSLARSTKYCQGVPRCCFGPSGQRAQPRGPALCIFCDVQRLNGVFEQNNNAIALRRRFGASSQMKDVALSRITDPQNPPWRGDTGSLSNARLCRCVGSDPRTARGLEERLTCDPQELNALLDKEAHALDRLSPERHGLVAWTHPRQRRQSLQQASTKHCPGLSDPPEPCLWKTFPVPLL